MTILQYIHESLCCKPKSNIILNVKLYLNLKKKYHANTKHKTTTKKGIN